MIRFDAEMFRNINNLAGRYPALDAVGVFCARYLIVVMFLAVIVRAVIVARRPESRTLAAALTTAEIRAFAAAALAFLGNWLFSRLVAFRPRPYVALKDAHRIIAEPLTSHAFPSGHSSVAFALAFTLLFVDPPFGVVMLIAAAAVAFGRVFTGVHYPLDVVVGAFVGLFWALTVHGIGTRLHDLDIVKRVLKLGRR